MLNIKLKINNFQKHIEDMEAKQSFVKQKWKTLKNLQNRQLLKTN